MQTRIGIVIGRFQPFHLGHVSLLSQALKQNSHVIVVLGSSNRYRSIRNPFTVAQRRHMILEWLGPEANRVSFVSSPDNLYKEWSWKSEITRGVKEHTPYGCLPQYTLYGHDKGKDTYYLELFPEWRYQEVDDTTGIDATTIREALFEGCHIRENILPESTVEFLEGYVETQDFADLMEDWEFFKWEKRAFGKYPFPETLNFNCADAVVVCRGHILLVERGEAPGKNTWALPGGFKNQGETFEDACIRELKEETNLRVPEKVLRGSIRDCHMFDDPRRSIGIQRVSMAYWIDVQPNPDGSLPEVRPASDAQKAEWVPLSDALGISIFEDHLDIIRWFI